MGQELRAFTVNMKSLDQDIEDPIIAGAGDANGMTFRIIFTQEAAAQFTPETKVYLKWFHQQESIRGLNVFSHVENECYPVWEIHWPRNMLHEGDVLCNIEVVDDISITPSTNFVVHVLSDPNDGSSFVLSDDYTVFQTAVIELTSLADKAKELMAQMQQIHNVNIKLLWLPLAGFLFIFPGFITDVLAVLILLPPVENWLVKKFAGSMHFTSSSFSYTREQYHQGPIIDAEVEPVEEEEIRFKVVEDKSVGIKDQKPQQYAQQQQYRQAAPQAQPQYQSAQQQQYQQPVQPSGYPGPMQQTHTASAAPVNDIPSSDMEEMGDDLPF